MAATDGHALESFQEQAFGVAFREPAGVRPTYDPQTATGFRLEVMKKFFILALVVAGIVGILAAIRRDDDKAESWTPVQPS